MGGFFDIDESSEDTSFTIGMILACGCLAFSYMVSYFTIHRLQWTFVSEAAVALLIGICAGGFLKTINRTEGFQISIFYDVLLPPIIFSSGYSMSRRWFFANIYKILAFALLGTVVSTALTGMMLWGVAQTSAMSVNLSFKESLAFGSLISATDPVTTLAIFQELKVESQLFYIIFGESVFNDAVAIVLFETLKETLQSDHEVSVGVAIGKFFFVFIASMLLGCACGCFSAIILKFSRLNELTVELVVLLIFTYLPYLIGQVFSMSGIVAILFTGITMKHYTHRNMSPEASDLSEIIISLTASITETFVFLNLGTSVWTMPAVNVGFVLWALIIILIARAGQVYPLSFLLNAFEKNPHARLASNQMHMLWYSGLRGAIAYALAVDFPTEAANHESIKSTTMMLVLITILSFGTATVPALKLLGIRRKTSPHDEKRDHLLDADVESKENARPASSRRPDSSMFLTLTPHCMSMLEFDREYIQPCLVKKSRIGNRQDDFIRTSSVASRTVVSRRIAAVLSNANVQGQNFLSGEDDDDDVEMEDTDNLLESCGNRGSVRNLGRVGGRWWMRSMRFDRDAERKRYSSMAFSELKEVAKKVLKQERPRFATRSMLIKLLDDGSFEEDDRGNRSSDNTADVPGSEG